LPLNGWEIVAILAFVFVKAVGGTFIEAISVVLLVLGVGVLMLFVWSRAGRPTARKLQDEGLAGAGKTAYEKLIRPLLYGRKGRRER
jgi:hypothetical protein